MILDSDRWKFQSVFDGFNYADWADGLDWPPGWHPRAIQKQATLIVQIPVCGNYSSSVIRGANVVKLCYWEKITVVLEGTKAFLAIPLRREAIQNGND